MSLAREVATALGAKGPTGSVNWSAKCPIHDEKKGRSLSFNEDCYECHGGKCNAEGHITELATILGLSVERAAPNGSSAAEAYRLLEVQAGHKRDTLDRYGVTYQRGARSYPYPGGATKQKRTSPKGFHWLGTDGVRFPLGVDHGREKERSTDG